MTDTLSNATPARRGGNHSSSRRSGNEPRAKRIRPVFIDLVAETHDRPACELAPIIRRSLIEEQFAVSSPASPVEIDREVERVIEALEDLRQAGLKNGDWSTAPVPPLMCG